MTVQFPAIQPTAHEFVQPEWPVTQRRAQSGVRSVRQWGSMASDGTVTFTFANITQAAAAAIIAAHDAARGIVDDVLLPPILFKNVDDPTALAMLSAPGPGLRWYFTGPPQGSRVQGGKRVTVRVELRAELRL
jgi:hypothetical protein